MLAVALVGGGAYALLIMYGNISTSASIGQSILIDGKSANQGGLDLTEQVQLYGGETNSSNHTITNRAKIPLNIMFRVDNPNPDLSTIVTIDGVGPITNYTMPGKSVKGFELVYTAAVAANDNMNTINISVLPAPPS